VGPTSGGPLANGNTIDPTVNVKETLAAAVQRQDDLRAMEANHIREIMSLRAAADHQLRDADQKLRAAESSRIDAIRAVDVGAVNRAAEVSAAQALTLATQVATSAETLRTQVAAAAQAQTIALAAALEPIQKDIQDLRRVQYEQQGQKSATVEPSIVTPLLARLDALTQAQNEAAGARTALGENRGARQSDRSFVIAAIAATITLFALFISTAGVVVALVLQ
jgi:hypothetical protein